MKTKTLTSLAIALALATTLAFAALGASENPPASEGPSLPFAKPITLPLQTCSSDQPSPAVAFGAHVNNPERAKCLMQCEDDFGDCMAAANSSSERAACRAERRACRNDC